MKIAVCLSGQLRTAPYCAPIIRRYFESHNPDYFLHTWSHDNWRTSLPEASRKPEDELPIPVPEGIYERVVAEFNPIAHRQDPMPTLGWAVSQSQQLSFLRSFELLEGTGQTYDVVVKCRMDVIWHPDVRFTPGPVDENHVYVSLKFADDKGFPCVTDRIFYGTHATMRRLSELYEVTKQKIVEARKITSYHPDHPRLVHTYLLPEQALFTFCVERGITLQETNQMHGPEIIVRKGAVEQGLNLLAEYEQVMKIQHDLWKADREYVRGKK